MLPAETGNFVARPGKALAAKLLRGKWRIELHFQIDRLQGSQIAIAIGNVDAQHKFGAPLALGRCTGEIGMMALGQLAIESQHFGPVSVELIGRVGMLRRALPLAPFCG